MYKPAEAGNTKEMATRHVTLGGCDGFGIYAPLGLLGWVEEAWVGPDGEASAYAVRLLDGRRGLLSTDQVDEVAIEQRSISVPGNVRLLELEPPQVPVATPVRQVAAAWRTNGHELRLPEPPGYLHAALLNLHRPVVPTLPDTERERPIWTVLVLMCMSLGLIALAVIGLDLLLSYAVTGGQP